jgi:hypothetical protein
MVATSRRISCDHGTVNTGANGRAAGDEEAALGTP